MKTICIYHSRDLDGWMSAAIVKHWFSKTYPKYDGISDLNKESHSITPLDEETTGERLAFLGWDYGDEVPDLSEYDKVIMCDISFSQKEMEKLCDRLDNQFIWIDHHISVIKSVIDGTHTFTGLRDTEYAACELTWKYFFPDERMPEIVRRLGMYDSFRHKGTDEEIDVLEFQYGARATIEDYEDAYECLVESVSNPYIVNIGGYPSIETVIAVKGEYVYEYLCTEAKQTYKKAFPVELMEPAIGTVQYGATTRKFLCVNQERFNPINFGIDYHKDGYDGFACFWFKDGKWVFSLYNNNGEVDCSAIAKQYGGGGHKGAAGFVVDDLYRILEENN